MQKKDKANVTDIDIKSEKEAIVSKAVKGLNGLTIAEWEEVKEQVDDSIRRSYERFKTSRTLIIS